ncbi:zinc-binding alcohol dehydrogenase family protein [Pseudalkalibacillus sp. A8]|uniref:quinone oxidoreductase family protein n=1 Tax=Pseudalkalibacillus sp. A8 TaxID=3382641 RepID=UPI0038B43509
MKGIYITKFGGPDVLETKEVPMPTINENQVLIRTDAASVNFADIKIRKGIYPGVPELPILPGLDGTGTLVEVGSNVTNVKVGQRVIAFPGSGSYADYFVSEGNLTFRIPDTIDVETAAAFPIVSFTAYNLLQQAASIAKGETVLIHAAAGGVGTVAIQMAKLFGAGRVIGTVGSDQKRDIARAAGADDVINYEEEDFVEKVRASTDGKGVDIVLDSIGGGVFDKSFSILRMFGCIVNYGAASGQTNRIETNNLFASCRSVVGYSLGSYRKYRPEALQKTAEKVIPLLANGDIQMVIGERFSLSEASKAHEWIEQRKSVGKVLLFPK